MRSSRGCRLCRRQRVGLSARGVGWRGAICFRDRFVEQFFFFRKNGACLRGVDIFLRGRRLIFIEQKNGGVNGGVRIVHSFRWQFFHDRRCPPRCGRACRARKHRSRRRSRRSARARRLPSRRAGLRRDFDRRSSASRAQFAARPGSCGEFSWSCCAILIQIRQIVVRAINLEKRVERFRRMGASFATRFQSCSASARQTPFRREAREIDFSVGMLGGGALGGSPERRKFGVGGGLARLLAPYA